MKQKHRVGETFRQLGQMYMQNLGGKENSQKLGNKQKSVLSVVIVVAVLIATYIFGIYYHGHREWVHDQRQYALNTLASVKGVKSITFSNMRSETEKGLEWKMYGMKLPDSSVEVADMRVDMDDGSYIVLTESPGASLEENVTVEMCKNKLFRNDPHFQKGLYENDDASAKLVIHGKEFFFLHDSDESTPKSKAFFAWQLKHKGKTLNEIQYTSISGGRSSLKLSPEMLKEYAKWEKENIESTTVCADDS